MDGKRPFPSDIISLFVIIAVQIGGFALLWSKDASPPEYVYLPATTDKTTTGSPTNSPVVVVSPPDEKALRKVIQAVLEQELTAYIVRNSPYLSNKKEKSNQVRLTGVEENSAENMQAYTTASSVVQNAIAAGTWTPEDNAKMALQARQLTSAQRDKFLTDIANAINRQELKPQILPLF